MLAQHCHLHAAQHAKLKGHCSDNLAYLEGSAERSATFTSSRGVIFSAATSAVTIAVTGYGDPGDFNSFEV